MGAQTIFTYCLTPPDGRSDDFHLLPDSALNAPKYARSVPAAPRTAIGVVRLRVSIGNHARACKPQIQLAISWAGRLPPRICEKFKKNYTAELFGPDSVPNIRLLSNGWPFRLSAKLCQEAMEARAHKAVTKAQFVTKLEGRPLTASHTESRLCSVKV